MRAAVSWLALACVLGAVPLQARQAGVVLSPEQYVTALDRTRELVAALDPAKWTAADAILSALPRVWTVRASDRTYEVPTAFLMIDLQRWRDHPDATLQVEMVRGLDQRRREAAALRGEPRDISSERAALTRVLAQREFHGVHGPTWFEDLRARALAWLTRWLRGLVRSAYVPTLTRVAVYALVGLAIVALGIALFRVLRPRDRDRVPLVDAGIQPSARAWRQWLAEADAAAAAGHWRDAIHAAYWCGIAFLEKEGTWRPDAARTPREYLRLLPGAAPAAPALTRLTHLLERVWYGTQSASAADFDRARMSLKELGCASE